MINLDEISVNDYIKLCQEKLREYNNLEKTLAPDVSVTQRFSIDITTHGTSCFGATGSWSKIEHLMSNINESINALKRCIQKEKQNA